MELKNKAHHGRIRIVGEFKLRCPETGYKNHGLGWRAYGELLDHPFMRGEVTTSEVIAFDPDTGEMETRNSRYRLVFDGKPSRMKGFALEGDKVVFLNANGYEHERAEAVKVLDPTIPYVVEDMDIQDFSSTMKLVGVPGRWNTVMFEIVDPVDA